MDSAACIGCGACVAACKNAAAHLFTGAKMTHLALLPQGHPERERRVVRMVEQMEGEGFGNCSNEGECEAVCPKLIPISNISKMVREYSARNLEGRYIFMTSTSSLTAAADFIKRRLFLRLQLDFDNLLDAFGAQLDRHAEIVPLHAVLALQVHRARENLLFILQDRFDHLGR